jgi:hypothetical protein
VQNIKTAIMIAVKLGKMFSTKFEKEHMFAILL